MDKRLLFLMNMAQRNMFNHAEKVCEQQLGFTLTQMAAVMFVNNNPGCMQKDVVQGLGLKKSAVTSLLSRTESNGLIRRVVSEDEARVVNLFATEQGKDKSQLALPLIAELNQQLTDGFNEEEIAVIARFLNQVRDRF